MVLSFLFMVAESDDYYSMDNVNEHQHYDDNDNNDGNDNSNDDNDDDFKNMMMMMMTILVMPDNTHIVAYPKSILPTGKLTSFLEYDQIYPNHSLWQF